MQYFAGANTRYGFRSIFEERFKNIERVFILKGSSGCGKSTLMRRIAGKAKVLGIETDLIFCSSDPDSLDGVVIPSLGVAIADGTSPHTLDVKYPCVKENIINLGQFWNEKKILPKRENIIFLTDKKASCYKKCYKCLSSAGELSDIKKALISQAINREKAESNIFKLLEKVGKSSASCSSGTIFARAFTSSGYKTLPVFERIKVLYHINGFGSEIFMNLLERAANEMGLARIVSYDPINPENADAIYFPETETIITSLQTPICGTASIEKNVSSARFVDQKIVSAAKARIRGIEKLKAEILSEAQKELTEAKNIHNSIESIYIPAMDFAAMDEFTNRLSESIFSE